MIDIATAPDFGYRSPTTANIVGQKKVFPTAYTPRARSATGKDVMLLERFKPIKAITEQTSSKAIGLRLSLVSIQCAQNRSPNMMAEVQRNNALPSPELKRFPVMFWIHESVPNSTEPTNAWVKNKIKRMVEPIAKLVNAPAAIRSTPPMA